ncbi:MAG: DUF1214 domain-containing protein [Methylobacteriaceae bacterium]|nr:DUF1214 domain-containing protein [Methylobacteriaceae bacterium]
MRLGVLIKVLLTLALGAALGLGATWAAVWHGAAFGGVVAGPWRAWPRAGARDRDPYAAAVLARTGEIPLDLAEGLVFYAETDSDDRALTAACVYRLRGPTPPARFWTLTATGADGHLIENPAGRYGFTSSEVLRDESGAFEIVLSSRARPGVWLPAPAGETFRLVLRLYDTPVAASAGALGPADMPAVIRESCA